MIICIKKFVNSNTAISYDDGKKCMNEIFEALKLNKQVTLDFSGVEFVITAFLNPVIGDLILENGPNVMKKINIVNATADTLEKIKIVKNGALLKREDSE